MILNIDITKGLSQKLVPKFKGPYKVDKVLRNNRYVIKDIGKDIDKGQVRDKGYNHQLTSRPYEGTWEARNMRPWVGEKLNIVHQR